MIWVNYLKNSYFTIYTTLMTTNNKCHINEILKSDKQFCHETLKCLSHKTPLPSLSSSSVPLFPHAVESNICWTLHGLFPSLPVFSICLGEARCSHIFFSCLILGFARSVNWKWARNLEIHRFLKQKAFFLLYYKPHISEKLHASLFCILSI